MTKLSSRLAFAAVIFALFLGAAFGQSGKAVIATQDDIDRDMANVPCKGADRLAAAEKLFRSMGAADEDISYLEKGGIKDLIVTRKGTGTGTITVGAHYDKVDDGCGAIDNWTGIVAIARLYATLRSVATVKTFKFVAFDKEEKGLLGSDALARSIAKEDRPSYCSMVNFDSFGFTQPWVMENTSDPKMIADAKELWTTMKLKLQSVPINNADADSTSFLHAGIPAITFTGLDSKWQKYLHSNNDKLTNVNGESVYLGYRFVLPFLTRLDAASCDAFRKK